LSPTITTASPGADRGSDGLAVDDLGGSGVHGAAFSHADPRGVFARDTVGRNSRIVPIVCCRVLC
jgi:hypothetical protein